jgi:hypothetical protein
VIINVLRPDTGWRNVWATIGYAWESLEFYRNWSVADYDPVEMKGPYLDPLNRSIQVLPILLDLFREVFESPDSSSVSNGITTCSGVP